MSDGEVVDNVCGKIGMCSARRRAWSSGSGGVIPRLEVLGMPTLRFEKVCYRTRRSKGSQPKE